MDGISAVMSRIAEIEALIGSLHAPATTVASRGSTGGPRVWLQVWLQVRLRLGPARF